MNKNHRNFFLTLAVIALGFFLFAEGCSKREKGDLERPTVRVGYAGGLLSRKIMERVIENFEKENPSIDVRLDFMEGNYYEKVQIQIAGGTAPDIIWIQDIRFPGFLAKGVFRNLNEFIKEDMEFTLDDYFPQTLSIYKQDGAVFAIPQNCAPLMFQYNMDLFDEAGIEYPDKDWTWEEFLEIAHQLTKDIDADGRIDRYGFTGPQSVHTMAMLIRQNGGDLLDVTKRTARIDSPEAIEAVRFYIDLVRKHRVAPRPEATRDTPSWEMYRRGLIGMTQYICPWAPEALKYQKFRWGVLPVPRGKTRKTVFFSDGFAIYKHTKYPQESWQFLKYLTGEEGQRLYCEEHKIFPTLKSVARSEVFLDPEVPPANKEILLEAVEYSEFLPILPEFIEIDLKVISKELDLAFMGHSSPEEACINMKKGIEMLLGKSEG